MKLIVFGHLRIVILLIQNERQVFIHFLIVLQAKSVVGHIYRKLVHVGRVVKLKRFDVGCKIIKKLNNNLNRNFELTLQQIVVDPAAIWSV
jgi:hypothetical protein